MTEPFVESTANNWPATDKFQARHVGPSDTEQKEMLELLGYKSLDGLIADVVPQNILIKENLRLNLKGLSEFEALEELRSIARKNKIFKSFIGQGYYDTITPPVIQRNILENPGWYTQYTPYQAEISQGRLEALLNFQTLISDLTGLPVSNASLLDEATAAAEAMNMAWALRKDDAAHVFLVSDKIWPQTLDVLKVRAEPLGIKIKLVDISRLQISNGVFGGFVQYPHSDGSINHNEEFSQALHKAGALLVVAADLLSLCLFKPPGEWGADIVVGSAQRFGVPMGFGGPHAAYLSTKDEFKRQIPGRLVGVSIDAHGKPALRLALQTREQHIRRAKATSNICTAQVLLAVMASMYAVYHGPEGLKRIASKVYDLASEFARGVEKLGYALVSKTFFDTITIKVTQEQGRKIKERAWQKAMNIWQNPEGSLCVSIDEAKSPQDIIDLLEVFDLSGKGIKDFAPASAVESEYRKSAAPWRRQSEFLKHPVFHQCHTETEMLRYIHRLQKKDLSLTSSMIPLGSCTMKLNATAEMFPVTWPEFSLMHPFAPQDQTLGYLELIKKLESQLCEITGFDAFSLQPNAGSQGEYAGLLAIRAYHKSKNQGHRQVCLIPTSAHGTNPASAVMAGMQVVPVECETNGNVSLIDLRKKAETHAQNLAALMITYPSTHGVFEEDIREICDVVHRCGGQVYMDGANMNAQVGLCKPAQFGADVCHLNLHKTFCIPHGGGGPGVGPIGVKAHLAPFVPGHALINPAQATGHRPVEMAAVAAAPWGSASILPISYSYIRMMGASGLKVASQVAILNANYIAKRLEKNFPILYKGRKGLVAHECIVDLRPLKKECGVEVFDVAKRLMDYGFHAPTVSWPVAGTLMIEPTESESLVELDRFCEAMESIAKEAENIKSGKWDLQNNPLKNAPHTMAVVVSSHWDKSYSREEAAFPTRWQWRDKFWPPVSRVNDPHGDRHLICTCPTVAESASEII